MLPSPSADGYRRISSERKTTLFRVNCAGLESRTVTAMHVKTEGRQNRERGRDDKGETRAAKKKKKKGGGGGRRVEREREKRESVGSNVVVL